MRIVTSRERDVRMPRTQIGLEPNGQGRVLNPLVKLKEMRMAFSDADPDYFHHSLRRKRSDSFDRQKKCAKFDCLEFLAQRKNDILRYLGKKTEREMDLIDNGPAHAANMRIKLGENLTD